MTEAERTKLLTKAEQLMLRNKARCKSPEKRRLYGCGAVALARDKAYVLTQIDRETLTGNCLCSRVTPIIDGEFYCKYCGQRLTAVKVLDKSEGGLK